MDGSRRTREGRTLPGPPLSNVQPLAQCTGGSAQDNGDVLARLPAVGHDLGSGGANSGGGTRLGGAAGKRRSRPWQSRRSPSGVSRCSSPEPCPEREHHPGRATVLVVGATVVVVPPPALTGDVDGPAAVDAAGFGPLDVVGDVKPPRTVGGSPVEHREHRRRGCCHRGGADEGSGKEVPGVVLRNRSEGEREIGVVVGGLEGPGREGGVDGQRTGGFVVQGQLIGPNAFGLPLFPPTSERTSTLAPVPQPGGCPSGRRLLHAPVAGGHLVAQAVAPAFEAHLARVVDAITGDSDAAAEQLVPRRGGSGTQRGRCRKRPAHKPEPDHRHLGPGVGGRKAPAGE